MIEFTCEICECKFNTDYWHSGECPECHSIYYWEEIEVEDPQFPFTGTYPIMIWKRNDS